MSAGASGEFPSRQPSPRLREGYVGARRSEAEAARKRGEGDPGGDPLTRRVVAFGGELRRAGVGVTSVQLALFVEALAAVGVRDAERVRDAAHATLCASRDDIAALDAVFDRFWLGRVSTTSERPLLRARSRLPPAEAAIARRLGRDPDETPEPASDRAQTWSASEVLRHKRFDRLTDVEAEALVRLMARAPLPVADRITRRYAPAARGRVLDWRRTVREAVRHDGELVDRRWRRRVRAPRPLVVLVDISGSMERYSRMVLTLLHAFVQRSRGRWSVEVFVFGTRLTRVTRAMRTRRLDAALEEAGREAVDWSGGTRIGESLHAFNRDWSRRVLGRGARVAMLSDGWDQGDPAVIARELARLRLSAHGVYWLNPLMDLPGYEPRTAGLVAATPHLTAMLPADTLAHLQRSLATLT